MYGLSATDLTDAVISYIRVHASDYQVPYTITGTRNNEEYMGEITYKQRFNIINIPITNMIYFGPESSAPKEHLHPSTHDIEDYILNSKMFFIDRIDLLKSGKKPNKKYFTAKRIVEDMISLYNFNQYFGEDNYKKYKKN